MTASRKLFSPTKTLAKIDSQMASEIVWIRELQDCYGSMLIDPETIRVEGRRNRLKNLFNDTKLDPRNVDHWKFLLVMVLETTYRKQRRGRPKGKPGPNLAREAAFVRDMAKLLKEKPSISTGKELARHLIGKRYPISDRSCENKISKMYQRLIFEANHPKAKPRLPMPLAELGETMVLLSGRLKLRHKNNSRISR